MGDAYLMICQYNNLSILRGVYIRGTRLTPKAPDAAERSGAAIISYYAAIRFKSCSEANVLRK